MGGHPEIQGKDGFGRPFGAIPMDLNIKGGVGADRAIKELIKIDPDIKAIVTSGYGSDPVAVGYEEYGFRGAQLKNDK